jgi:2',3'-cyclic-nucleotide 2'-phosphodiesterase (5'-nucleotidase family)
MYVANFICDDRNGDDGIYGTEYNDIGAHRFATMREALDAIRDDADSHAAMYADTAERHWHGAFSAAAAYFHTADAAYHAADFATSNGGGYRYRVYAGECC